MPRKAMKCVVEVDIHVITCPGTFLRDYEYVYLHMEMLGLEARTKSVPPTFPLFFHERLKFEKTFHDFTDPSLVTAKLKGEDIILELRLHTDYVSDGKVIAHCSSNTHDFLYPAIPAYYGSGREILLYKTSKFKPIRVTGEPVKLEFSTKTTIKEISDFGSPVSSPRRSASPSRRSVSPGRRSVSPGRRSASPSRARKTLGNATVESLPAWKYGQDFPRMTSSTPSRHHRSITAPTPLSSSLNRSLRHALDDLDVSSTLSKSYVDPVLSYRVRASPNLQAALKSSDRIQQRVEEVSRSKLHSVESGSESDDSLDVLRESLREERNALNDAIREADREAFYRSLNRSR